MKKILTLILIAFALQHVAAQTTIYNQNFDGGSSLPAGWYASSNSWYIDTTGGNASSGYHGASGLNNIVIKDTTAPSGPDTLITEGISTIGYNNITVEWGTRFSKHFADSGSTMSLYWSTDGMTWANISYTENASNSNWALENDSTPIALPAGAANQASLRLMWVADIKFTPSGTYRIDDLTVGGAVVMGINDIHADEAFANVFVSGNSTINISVKQPLTEALQIELYDLTGRIVTRANMNTQVMAIDGKDLSQGVYVVKVSDSNRTMTSKIVVK